jgi:multidrug resistance protein, MATE family
VAATLLPSAVPGERRLIARHAATIVVGQLAVMAFGVTDTIVAGHFAEGALAALSVGSALFVTVYASLMGGLQALMPVWAEMHGAGRATEVGVSVRQSLYLCAAAIAIGMAVLLFPAPLLRWTEVPAAMRADVEAYLHVLAFALAPSLLFRLFSTISQGLGKPQFVTWLQLASLGLKIPLSIWFAFGGAGLPALGLPGCAWATLVVNYTTLAAALWLLHSQSSYRAYGFWQRIEAPDRRQLRQFARLGLPAGLAVLVEVTSFTLMALFIARLGATASAAHQIASNLMAVGYMLPLSLSLATSARVSFWLGAGEARLARRACRNGFELTWTLALIYAAMIAACRWQLAGIYSADPAVIALGAALLLTTAGYHLADSTQTLCIFVLRCYRVTVAPLLLYCTLLWGVGLGGSYLLAYRGLGPWPAMQSPQAFWLMSTVALALTAALFLALLASTLRRRG